MLMLVEPTGPKLVQIAQFECLQLEAFQATTLLGVWTLTLQPRPRLQQQAAAVESELWCDAGLISAFAVRRWHCTPCVGQWGLR